MPFNKFLNQTPEDFGAALQVSGFSIRNEYIDHPNKEPFPFDYNLSLFNQGDPPKIGSRVASGEFYTDNPVIHWNLVNPATNSIVPENEISQLQSFYGYDLKIKDETGKLIKTIATGYKKNDFKVDIKTLINDFQGIDGQDPRRFRFEVATNDYYNRSYTGTYFLNAPKPNVTGLYVDIGANSLRLEPELEKVSGIQSVGYYAATYSGFTINPTGSGSLTHQFSYQQNFVGKPNASFGIDLEVPSDSGLYYMVVASDQYGTGDAYVFPSSVKTFSIDPLQYNVKPSGLEGKVAIERDGFNRVVTTKAVAKFNRDFIGFSDYEVKVVESGKLLERTDSFYIQTPFIEGVDKIIQGTGSSRLDLNYLNQDFSTQDFYYSGLGGVPVFTTYNTTGIQWKDHTLLLDASKSLPPQFLTGQSLIQEVAIPAGNTLSQKIYFGFAFDQNTQDWVFYPSGGYYDSGIYTGTYADAATGGVLTYISNDPDGPSATGPQGDIISSGFFAVETGATGALVATNLSGFLLTEYEPRFSYDVDVHSNYKFSVRPRDVNGNFGEASDLLSITTGDILNAITGAGFPTGLFQFNFTGVVDLTRGDGRNSDGQMLSSGVAVYNPYLDILDISSGVFASGTALGIATDSPTEQLEISGDGNVYAKIDAASYYDAGLKLFTQGNQGDNSAVTWSIVNNGDDNGDLKIRKEGTDKITINREDGNLGINTVAPTARLHVGGDVKIDSVSQDASATNYLVWDASTKLIGYASAGAGAQGSQGAQGSIGNQGDQGSIGNQGAQGATGNQGAQGFQGNQGAQGAQGAQGFQGDQGAQGFQGFQGDQGAQGFQGNQGAQGAQGFQGDQGAQGFQGNQGAQGAQGFQGFQGDQGAQGFQGNQGAQGAQGSQGFQGDQGAQGFQGNQGAQGAQGFQGDQGAQGFQGNQGAQGAQGFQGFQGDQGAQGFQGNQGAQGAQGSQGFQGDQGAQGFQGNQGAQGAQGFQGDQGAQGFQGNQGAQGAKGDQGFQGDQGAQGFQGNQGAQGAQGFQGHQGGQGNQGAQGAKGDQGFQGNQGAQGYQGDSFWSRSSGNLYPTTISDNVGIGTSSPINKLHVVGQSVFDNNSSNINIKNTWSSGNHDINFIGGSTSGGTANNTAARIRCLATAPGGAATGDLTFTVNSGDTFVDALYIQEDGNVGIGTSSPERQFHVLGGTADNSSTTIRIGGSTNHTSRIELAESVYSGTMSYGFTLTTDGGSAGGGTNNFLLRNHNNSSVGNVALSVERANGYIGIGTATPTEELHLIKSADTGIGMEIDNGNSGASAHARIGLKNNSDDLFYILNHGSGRTASYRYNIALANYSEILAQDSINGLLIGTGTTDNPIIFGNNSSERMRIAAGGNVGIGTSSPSALLHIRKTSLVDDSRNALLLLDGKFAAAGVNSADEVGIAFRVENSGGGAQQTTSITSSYQPTYNSLNLQPAGGNVGIGTNTPDYKLDIYGSFGSSAGAGLRLRSTATDDNGIIHQQADGTAWFTGQETSNPNDYEFWYNNGSNYSHIMHLDNSGSIGIGTSGPAYRTTIYGGTDEGITLSVGSGLNAYNFVGIGLAGYIAGNAANKAVFALERTGIYGTGKIHFLNDGALDNGDATLADSKLTIQNDGNVGIGTTSPREKLNLQDGNFVFTGSRSGDADIQSIIWHNTNSTGFDVAKIVGKTGTNIYEGIIRFETKDSGGTMAERMRIASNGYVGIGVSPSYKLDVLSTTTPVARFQGGTNAYSDFTDGTINYRVQVSGDVYIGATSNHKLILKANDLVGITIDTSQGLQFNGYGSGGKTGGTPAYKLTVDSSGNLIEVPVGSGQVDGSGTENYLAKWTDSDTISNSVIYDDGTNVSIGTQGAIGKLNVKAASGSIGLSIGNTTGDTRLDVTSTENSNVTFNICDAVAGTTARHFIIQTAGTERFRVQSDGNVSIGSSSPQHKLQVSSAQSGGIQFTYDSTNNYRNQILNYWNSSTDSRIDFNVAYTSGATPTNIMSVGYAGYVGIGTQTPSAKLDIRGTGADGTELLRIESSGDVADGGYHWMTSEMASSQSTNANIVHLIGVAESTKNSAYIGFHYAGAGSDSNYLTLGGYAANNLLIIQMDGNVGIGTTGPVAKLDVVIPDSAGTTKQVVQRWLQTSQNTLTLNMYGGATDLVQLAATNGEQNISIVTEAAASVGATTNKGIYIQSGGNVGIGTTSPAGKLDVRAGSGGEIIFGTYDANFVVKIQSGDQLNFYNGTSGTAGYINYGGGATVLSQNLHVEKATGGTTGLVRIDANGNVGIGTTGPTYKLDVAGDARINDSGAANGTASETMRVVNTTSGATSSYMYIGASSGTDWKVGKNVLGTLSRTNFDITTHTDTFGLTINTGGCVGIGTSTPAATLHVNGQSYLIGANYGIYGNNDSTNYRLFDNASGQLVYNWYGAHIWQTAGGSERMRLNFDGNLGIGTTGPSYKLEVITPDNDAISVRATSASHGILIGAAAYSASNSYMGMKTSFMTGGSEYMILSGISDGSTYISAKTGASAYLRGGGNNGNNEIVMTDGGNNTYKATGYHYFETGNVGIGAAPSYKLDVNGDIRINSGNVLRLFSSGGTERGSIQATDTDHLIIATSGGEHIRFKDGGVSGTTNMSIFGTGQIAFNNYGSGGFTGTPAYKLSVDSSGNIIETAVGAGQVDGSGTANYIPKWTDSDTIGNSIAYDNGTNIGIGTSGPTEKLEVNGNIKHQGLTMTSGTDIDQLSTFSQTLTISTSWGDTGISSSNLATGTYIVQLFVNDYSVGGGQYSVYYSGTMSWYGTGTNDANFGSEIILHRAGHADNDKYLYLRTLTQTSSVLKLQIAGNYTASGSSTYTFKFRRMI